MCSSVSTIWQLILACAILMWILAVSPCFQNIKAMLVIMWLYHIPPPLKYLSGWIIVADSDTKSSHVRTRCLGFLFLIPWPNYKLEDSPLRPLDGSICCIMRQSCLFSQLLSQRLTKSGQINTATSFPDFYLISVWKVIRHLDIVDIFGSAGTCWKV